MHLPRQMNSKWIVFVSAVAIIFFGFIAIILAIQRMQGSHRLDRGLLLGIGFIIWGAWALLFVLVLERIYFNALVSRS